MTGILRTLGSYIFSGWSNPFVLPDHVLRKAMEKPVMTDQKKIMSDAEILEANEAGRRLLKLGEDMLCLQWVLGRMEEARQAGRAEGAEEQMKKDAKIARSAKVQSYPAQDHPEMIAQRIETQVEVEAWVKEQKALRTQPAKEQGEE